MRNIYPGTGMTMGAIAIGLAMPLTMAFLASCVTMAAVRRAVVKAFRFTGKTAAGFVARETTCAVTAETGIVAARPLLLRDGREGPVRNLYFGSNLRWCAS